MQKITEAGIFESGKKFGNSFRTPERVCNEFEIECFLSGNGCAVIDGNVYPHREGMIVCAPPGTVRYSEGRFTCFYIHFESDTEVEKILAHVPRCFMPAEKDKFKIKLASLIELYHARNGISRLKLESELFDLFGMLLSPGYPQSSEWVGRAKEYMSNHFAENITLSDIAQSVNISPAHFHRQFKKLTGLTPRETLLSIRMAASKRMLLYEEAPLSVIAENCGFSSQAYFQYCFKKETGMTPGEFRLKRFVMPE